MENMNSELGMDTVKVERKSKGISGFTLKIIAIISMLIDHSAVVFLEPLIFLKGNTDHSLYIQYSILRGIGRIAFPIFCFLLVEGFIHTKNVKKYALRLLIFALISEIPFDLALLQGMLDFNHQNVFFTLFFGLLCIWGMESLDKKYGNEQALKRDWGKLFIFALCSGAVYFLKTDYDIFGIVAIVFFYLMRDSKFGTMFANIIGFTFEAHGFSYLVYAAVPLIYAYNGERGRNMKYFFYAFYPVHLLSLYLLAHFVFQTF